MSARIRSGWKRAAGFVFAAAAFLFLGFFVVRNAEQLRNYSWSIRPALLAASVAVNIIGLALGVAAWQLVLRKMDRPVEYLPLARVWFVSGLGRYIPGKIWQFVGAAHLGGLAGLEPVTTVSSLALQNGFFIIGAALTAVYLLPAEAVEYVGPALGVLPWIAPLLLLLAHPALISRVIRVARRASSRSMAGWTGSWMDGIVVVLLAAVAWAITGAGLYLFVVSLTPINDAGVANLIGINALSFVIGYAVFVAPAGLGAKEVSLTALLTLYMPAPVAALIAVAARLWMVAGEVIPALLLLPRRGSSERTANAAEAVSPPST